MKKLFFVCLLVASLNFVIADDSIEELTDWTYYAGDAMILKLPTDFNGFQILAVTAKESCNRSQKSIEKKARERAQAACEFVGATTALPPRFELLRNEDRMIEFSRTNVKAVGYETGVCKSRRGFAHQSVPRVLTEIVCIK